MGSSGGLIVNKEMRAVFQEILESIREICSIQGFIIEESAEGGALKLMGELDAKSLGCLEPLLAKHKLEVKEEKDFIVIRRVGGEK